MGFSHLLFADAPLTFPDLSGIFAPWAFIAWVVGTALIIGRSRGLLLIAAIFGFASGIYWLVQVATAASFYSGMIALLAVMSFAAWLLTLRAWFLAGSLAGD